MVTQTRPYVQPGNAPALLPRIRIVAVRAVHNISDRLYGVEHTPLRGGLREHLRPCPGESSDQLSPYHAQIAVNGGAADSDDLPDVGRCEPLGFQVTGTCSSWEVAISVLSPATMLFPGLRAIADRLPETAGPADDPSATRSVWPLSLRSSDDAHVRTRSHSKKHGPASKKCL